MSSLNAENKKYLNQKVNPILELLIASLMKNRPDDVAEYCQNWLEQKGTKLEQKIKSRVENRPEGIPTTSESEMDDDDEEMDVYEQELEKKALIRKQNPNQMRVSVSAEVYGEHNKKEDFNPPIHQKQEDTIQDIIQKLEKSVLFSSLEKSDKRTIALAMDLKTFNKGDMVITEGDDGNELYIVDEGQLTCTKKNPENGEDIFLVDYSKGDVFGELALLYNAPRAASIKSNTESKLYSLDRYTFNHIVKESMIKKRDSFQKFLSQIELLDTLTTAEKDKLCDVLQIQEFKKNEFVIKEGEEGNTFYFIKEGHAVALQEQDGQQKEVYQYKENDYFGELALLKDQPRAASIQATSTLVVAKIDRPSFKRLLGPLEDILKRNTDKYNKFVNEQLF